MGLRGLADHQRGDERLVEGVDERVRQPLGLLLVTDGELERLVEAAEFDEGRDRVEPVGVLMGLCPQSVGEGAQGLELPGELREVRAVAQGDDGAAGRLGVAVIGLGRGLLADDEDSVGGEMGLVDGDPTGFDKGTDRGWEGHLGEGNRLPLIGSGQVEEACRLIVVEDELPRIVDEDEPLAQGVEGGVVEREEALELLGTVAEGDPAQVAGEDPRPEPAEGDRDGRDDDDLGHGGGLGDGDRRERDADGDHRGDLAGVVDDRDDRPDRGAERADVLLGLALPAQGGVDGAEVVLAELAGVRVGVAGAVAVHDRHEVDVGGAHHGLRIRLEGRGGIGAGDRLGDVGVVGERFSDAEHPVTGGVAGRTARRGVARDAQHRADDDDEDELGDEEPTGQRQVPGAAAAGARSWSHRTPPVSMNTMNATVTQITNLATLGALTTHPAHGRRGHAP